MVNLPIQIQWNNERIVKANKRIAEEEKRIVHANKRIAEAKIYLSDAIERCKATYGDADTAVALEALMRNVGGSPTIRRESGPPHPSAALSAGVKKARTSHPKK